MWKLLKVEKETESNCWHCGTKIKYVCWVENEETGETLAVGRDCCSKFMRSNESRQIVKKIDIEIDNLNKVDRAHQMIEKYAHEDEKKRAYRVYLALKCHVELMKKEFPEYAKIMGY
jgi:hypothetical protein